MMRPWTIGLLASVSGAFVEIERFYRGQGLGAECLTADCVEIGGRTEAEIARCLESVPSSCWFLSEQSISREWTSGCFNRKVALGSTLGLLGIDFADMQVLGGGRAVDFLEYSWTLTETGFESMALPDRCDYLVYKFSPDPQQTADHECGIPLFHTPGRGYPAGSVPIMSDTLHVTQQAALYLLNTPNTNSVRDPSGTINQDEAVPWVWFSETQMTSQTSVCLSNIDSAKFQALLVANHTGRLTATRRKAPNEAVFVPSIAAVSLSAMFLGK